MLCLTRPRTCANMHMYYPYRLIPSPMPVVLCQLSLVLEIEGEVRPLVHEAVMWPAKQKCEIGLH
jgi:hypothetical protein